MTRVAILLWPDTFEDWYAPLAISRQCYLDDYDGEWSITLARALEQSGVEVHLVHGTLGEASTAAQKPSGATVHFVPTTVAYRALRTFAWGHRWWEKTKRFFVVAPVAAGLSPRLIRHVSRIRPDLVIVQDYETLRYDVLAPLLRLAGLRFVGLDTGASSRPSHAQWKHWTRGLAAHLLAVHGREAERLRSLGHQRVSTWPGPVRTDVFQPGDRAEARATLGVGMDETLVFTAARLHPVKNLPLLVAACRRLDATLVIAGEGGERGRLEKLGYARLRLLGWLSPEQLVAWYAAADVVALSSVNEGQPIAVLEALACARGVVSTDVGGTAEVVRPGETGWVVPPRDVDALADALQEALADRDRTDAYGRHGQQLVTERHSPEAVAAVFRALVS